LGSSLKARKLLNWKPKISLKELVKEMVSEELKNLNS
jgi:GDP-D-mannose dehydratase